MHYQPHNPYVPQHPPQPPHAVHPSLQLQAPPPPPGPGQVKPEPVESRFLLNGPPHYNLPPLPGPQIPGARPPAPAGQLGVYSL